ncbi:efflux RND transporter permease subunit [Dokdonia ponticola]|uniref:Efflux RND transporter permease subunit n=1 Tax=Dokdonia ponticola TaxID=2041041 RepID=A0ABV9HX25_9FLAO
MKISSFKICIITGILTALGFLVIPQLSVKLNPSTTLPSITVSYSWPNASPYALERDITSILEGGFSTLRGLEKVTSRSSKNRGYITLTFDKFTDIDIARFETATIIRQVYKQLPERVSYPTLSVNRPDDDEARAFMSYSINAPLPPFEIQDFVKTQIEPIIGGIADIDQVRVYGAQPKEFLITYKNVELQALGLAKQDLVNALQQAYERTSLGELNYQDQFITLAVQPDDSYLNWHIPIKKVGDRILYIDDVTTIKEQEQEATNYYRINGNNAITMALYAVKTANTIALKKEVEASIAALRKTMPSEINIIKTQDTTVYLQKELGKIYERSAYTVLILLLFILMVSRSFKYLLVSVLSLLANIGVAFLCYYFSGVEIQLYSLAGITISLGLIIDNAIVMIDHLRHQKNKNVFIPILASTLTTVGALSIINFLDDAYKVNLVDFAKVMIINLGISLAIALYLIPALLEKIPFREKIISLKAKKRKERFYVGYERFLRFCLRFKKWAIVGIILIFGIPFFMLPQTLEENDTWYQKAYNSTLGNEWFREEIRPHIDTYLGGSFRLFSYYTFESAYYGRNEETKLFVTAAMEKGATVHQMNEVFIGIENYLNTFPEIGQYTTQVSSGDFARIEIVFKEGYANSSFPFILKSRLIRKALDFGGIDWNIYGVGKGFNNGGGVNDPVNFSVLAKGYNYDQLNSWADSLKVTLEKHPRVQKVLITDNNYWLRKPSYEYRFTIDKEQLALNSLSPQSMINELGNVTLQKQQDLNLTISGISTAVRFEAQEANAFDIWHIKNSPLDSLASPVSLKEMVTITKEREEESIDKENQEYLRKVKFQYTGSAKFGNKFLTKTLDSLQVKLPLGYSFERDNQNWFLLQGKENKQYAWLLLLVLGIIYTICAILFESFKQPFIILSVIPISFIGVFLTFYLFDFNFDQGGLASFVLLSGITVNASIFIVNDFNKLIKNERGSSLQHYIQAFNQKIFPILLTVISTILGFIPFVKDGQNEVFWFALGVGTIGGLVFSLVGILLYLPLFSLKSKTLDI